MSGGFLNFIQAFIYLILVGTILFDDLDHSHYAIDRRPYIVGHM